MTQITTNALQIANGIRKRIAQIDAAKTRGLRKAAAAVNRHQLKNLSGHISAEPGTYPVPNRTGTLFRGAGFSVPTANTALVYNTTEYAVVIHEHRPFLDDAVDAASPTDIVMDEIRQVL